MCVSKNVTINRAVVLAALGILVFAMMCSTGCGGRSAPTVSPQYAELLSAEKRIMVADEIANGLDDISQINQDAFAAGTTTKQEAYVVSKAIEYTSEAMRLLMSNIANRRVPMEVRRQQALAAFETFKREIDDKVKHVENPTIRLTMLAAAGVVRGAMFAMLLGMDLTTLEAEPAR